jgi:hypothetical protein
MRYAVASGGITGNSGTPKDAYGARTTPSPSEWITRHGRGKSTMEFKITLEDAISRDLFDHVSHGCVIKVHPKNLIMVKNYLFMTIGPHWQQVFESKGVKLRESAQVTPFWVVFVP